MQAPAFWASRWPRYIAQAKMARSLRQTGMIPRSTAGGCEPALFTTLPIIAARDDIRRRASSRLDKVGPL